MALTAAFAHAEPPLDKPRRPPAKVKTLGAVSVQAADAGVLAAPDLPSVIHRIDAAQMKRINLVDPEDSLKYFPALNLRKRYVGDDYATLSVRGTSTSQTARGLVYLDGLLLSDLSGNTHTYAPRWSIAFPEHLQSVEVAYGAYSVLYPGNAIGAVVAMTTRMPQRLELDGDVQLYSQHVDAYGVDRNYGGSRKSASLGDRVGKLSFLLGVARLQNNSQPLGFATTQGLKSARGAAIPVSDGVPYCAPSGACGAIIGIASEGRQSGHQDQAKLRLSYDFTPVWLGSFSFGYWREQAYNHTRSYLRDPQGHPVDTGAVEIGGQAYQLDPALFAPSLDSRKNYLYGASLGTHRPSGWNLEWQASYYDRAVQQDRYANSALAENGSGTATYNDGSYWETFDVRASWQPDVDAPGSHHLSLGYHYDGYTLRSHTYSTAAWRGSEPDGVMSAYGGRTRTKAVYAQDRWRLDERWTLTYGLRYELWQAYTGKRDDGSTLLRYPDRQVRHASPKLSLSYQATDDWFLRLSVARAYRFPTVAELFQGSINGGQLIRNDPNLRSENDLARELSSDWYLAKGMLSASVYQSDTRDTLFSQTNVLVYPNVTNVQNVGLVRTRGAQLSYQAQDVGIAGLDTSANAAYTQATTVRDRQNPAAQGKQFYRIPRWRLKTQASLRIGSHAELSLAGRYASRQYNTLEHTDIYPNTYGGASAYLVWDARLSYRPDPHWELSLGIDNLTDRRYYDYYMYPLRSTIFEAKWHL